MKPLTIFLLGALILAFLLFMNSAGNVGLSLNNVTSTTEEFAGGVFSTFVMEMKLLFKSIFNPGQVLAGAGIGQQ